MVIKQKATRKLESPTRSIQASEADIEEVIGRGGKTTSENQSRNEDAETRFTLRLPKKIIATIDRHRSGRAGSVSRNQWIIEAIADKLNPK